MYRLEILLWWEVFAEWLSSDGLSIYEASCNVYAGNYWIYSIFGNFDGDDPNSVNFCHSTLYWFAFWLTTALYIMLGVFIVCGCAICCVFCCVIASSE